MTDRMSVVHRVNDVDVGHILHVRGPSMAGRHILLDHGSGSSCTLLQHQLVVLLYPALQHERARSGRSRVELPGTIRRHIQTSLAGNLELLCEIS